MDREFMRTAAADADIQGRAQIIRLEFGVY
jgi:hypothetical protein